MPVLLRYVKALIEERPHAVVCSDSTANLMSPAMYRKFAWPFEQRLMMQPYRVREIPAWRSW